MKESIFENYKKNFFIPIGNALVDKADGEIKFDSEKISYITYSYFLTEYKERYFIQKENPIIDRHKVCSVIAMMVMEDKPFSIIDNDHKKYALDKFPNETYVLLLVSCLIKQMEKEKMKLEKCSNEVIEKFDQLQFIFPPSSIPESTYELQFLKDLCQLRRISKKDKIKNMPFLNHIFYYYDLYNYIYYRYSMIEYA